ncbi:MAG: hypothetical protein NVS2B7_07780 [Herpetosiphon sp.]
MSETTAQPVIEMKGVGKKWGDVWGVRDLTFSVPAGQIFGVVGPSGSGKTTTIRMLTGVFQPTVGELRVLGATPQNFDKRARERIGYLPQLFVLYPTLTVWENLNFVASLYGMNWFSRRARLNELLDFVELRPAKHRLAEKISGGMKRRLELACALVHNPTLLFADEPTAGVDPVLRGKFWDGFRKLKAEGHSIVVTTQYVSEVEYCDQVAVIRAGRLLMIDTPDGLRRRAFGGSDVIALTVGARDDFLAHATLEPLPFVKRIATYSNSPAGLLYVYVDEASRRLPEIVQALGTQPSITTKAIEEYKPPYDDVFIALMQQADRADPEGAQEATND